MFKKISSHLIAWFGRLVKFVVNPQTVANHTLGIIVIRSYSLLYADKIESDTNKLWLEHKEAVKRPINVYLLFFGRFMFLFSITIISYVCYQHHFDPLAQEEWFWSWKYIVLVVFYPELNLYRKCWVYFSGNELGWIIGLDIVLTFCFAIFLFPFYNSTVCIAVYCRDNIGSINLL